MAASRGRALILVLALIAVVLALQWLPTDPEVIALDPDSGRRFLTLAILVAAFLTEDLACIGAGMLVAQGRIDLHWAIFACFVGFALGNVLLYALGAAVGRTGLTRRPVSWLLTPEQVQKSLEWFARRGAAAVFLTRFVPGTRIAVYFSAGLLGVGFRRFFFYLALSTALWVPLLVGGASWLGRGMLAYFAVFEHWALPAATMVVLALWWTTRSRRRQDSRRDAVSSLPEITSCSGSPGTVRSEPRHPTERRS
jgi:membrane protein DedA with SNARE-associated domain